MGCQVAVESGAAGCGIALCVSAGAVYWRSLLVGVRVVARRWDEAAETIGTAELRRIPSRGCHRAATCWTERFNQRALPGGRAERSAGLAGAVCAGEAKASATRIVVIAGLAVGSAGRDGTRVDAEAACADEAGTAVDSAARLAFVPARS